MEENKVRPEDLAPKTKQQPEEVLPPKKNAWWIKVMPHIFIVSLFLDMWCEKKINLLSMLCVPLWAWYGYKIQTDKKILTTRDIRVFLIVLAIVIIDSYHNVIQFIQWLSSLWGGVFFVDKEMNIYKE